MAEIPRTDAIADAIYKAYENKREMPRPHLGASLLGHQCARYLWLNFRWALPNNEEGRILRLFERGQREEEVIVKNLRSIGIDIHSTCLDKDGQTHVNLGGHLGGSVDGIIESGVPEAPKTRHIAEFKTHSLKSFTELEAKGVKESKFQHYVQMQCYMHGTGIDRALYVAVCKDNDRIYTERIRYMPQTAEFFIKRGQEISLSEEMPPMMRGASPSWYQCKFCPAYDLCHETHMCTEINCRTCAWSTAKSDGTWICEHRDIKLLLNYKEQLGLEDGERLDCQWHSWHPSLVPWQCIGSADDNDGAVYIVNGKRIINGGSIGNVKSRDMLNGTFEVQEEGDIPF